MGAKSRAEVLAYLALIQGRPKVKQTFSSFPTLEHRGRHGRQQELEEGRQGLEARQDARRHYQDYLPVLVLVCRRMTRRLPCDSYRTMSPLLTHGFATNISHVYIS